MTRQKMERKTNAAANAAGRAGKAVDNALYRIDRVADAVHARLADDHSNPQLLALSRRLQTASDRAYEASKKMEEVEQEMAEALHILDGGEE